MTDELTNLLGAPANKPTTSSVGSDVDLVSLLGEPELKKKEEPVSFGGGESLASPSAVTEDKQPLTYMQQQLRDKGLIVDAPTTKELKSPPSGSETLKALKSSSARALGGIVGLPNFLNDQLDHFVVKPILKGVGYSDEEADAFVAVVNTTPIQGGISPLQSNQGQQSLNKYASSIESTMKQYEEGIIGSLKNNNYGDAGAQLWKGAVQSLPYLAMTLATSGGGTPAVLSTIGTTAAAQRYGEITDPKSEDGKNLSETGKFVNSWAYGGMEAAGELITAGLLNSAKKAIGQIGKEAIDEVGSGFVKQALKSFGLEGSSEGATELGQQVTDYLQGTRENIDLKAVGDAVLVGGVTGAGIGGTTATANKASKMLAGRKVASDEDVAKVNENNTKIVDLLAEKQKVETPEASDIIDTELTNVAKENKDIIEANEKRAEKLAPEEIIKLKDLDDAIDSYDARIEFPSETDNPELLKQIKEKLVLDKRKLVEQATTKKQEPVVVFHSTYENFKDFKNDVNYFAEDPEYSKQIASEMNANGKASDFVETRNLNTTQVEISPSRIYELPKGQEMNSKLVDELTSDPEFTKKYDAIKGIDLYSKDKVVYAVLDKYKIKPIDPISEPIEPQTKQKGVVVPSETKVAEKQQKEVVVEPFKIGRGGTKGTFVDSEGTIYKSLVPTELRMEDGKGMRVDVKGKVTEEHTLLSELQDKPYIPKIGEAVDTNEGKAFSIEKLDEVESLTREEYLKLRDNLNELNDNGYHIGDNVTVMRRPKTKELVVVDFSNGYKGDRGSRDIEYLNDVESMLPPKDKTWIRVQKNATDKRVVAEMLPDKAEGKHEYWLTQRPPSIGTHPIDNLIGEPKPETMDGREVWKLTYSKELPISEVKRFELNPIISMKDYAGKIVEGVMGEVPFYISNIVGRTVTLKTFNPEGKVVENKIRTSEFLKKIEDGEYELSEPSIEQQQKQPIVGEQQIEQLKVEENGKENIAQETNGQGQQEKLLIESRAKLEREIKKEENKARLGRIFDNAAKLTGARLDITSEEKRTIRKELARDVVDYVKTEFDLLGEALVEKVKSFVKDNNIPLEDVSDQELNEVLTEKGYAGKVRKGNQENVGTQKGVVEGTEGKLPVGNDGKDQKTPRSEDGLVKDSHLGVRWSWGKDIAPEAQAKYKAEGLYAYKPEKQTDIEIAAASIVENNSTEKSVAILNDRAIARRVRMAVGVLLIEKINDESTKLYESGNTEAADELTDSMKDIMLTLQKEMSTETGQDLAFMASNFIMQRIGGYQLARLAQNGMASSRVKKTSQKGYQRIQKAAQDELKQTRKQVVEEVIKKVVEPKKQPTVDPRIAEIRKKRSSLIDQWTKAKQSRENTYSTVIPGLTNVDIEFGGKIALTYIEEGVYKTADLVKKLKKVFDRVGIEVKESDLDKLLPEQYNGKAFDEYQRDEDLEKASEALALKIFGDVIDKKAKKDDPLRQMVEMLFSKFKDTQITRKKGTPISPLEKLTQAIKNKDEYKEVWKSAKDEAINKINESKNLSDEQKQRSIDLVETAYKNATDFVFSDDLMKGVIRKELSEKNIDIAEVVRDHFDRRNVVKEDLKRSLIEKANLTENEAKMLSEAINKAFDTLIADRAAVVIKKYVERGKKKPSRKQAKGADAILQLANAGAFENEEFLNAFADAWGIPNLDAQDIKYIIDQSKKIQKIKGESMKYEEKQKLLASIANIQGMDWGELIDGIWYANVLSGAGTQLKNFMDANSAALVEPMLIAGSSQFKRTRLRRAIARTVSGRALQNLKHTFQTGKHPFDLGSETPKLGERILQSKDPLVQNKMAWKAIKMSARIQNGVFNLMMSNDAFAGTLAYESILDALITDSAYSEAKGSSGTSLTSEQKKALNQKIDEMLRITPEDQRIINEILDNESEEYKQIQAEDKKPQTGYSKEQRSIRFFEIMDSLRPLEFVEEARRISLEAVGNITPYGTLGFVVDKMASAFRYISFDMNKPIVTKVGNKFILTASPTEKIKITPFQKVIPFTRIITNIATRNLNWNPITAVSRLIKGKYGFSIGEKREGDRYVRELSKEEKKIIKRKIIVTATIASLAYFLTGGDDPEDGLIRITGNGTGNWKKNKQLMQGGWKPWNIQIGDFSISYQYIYPLNMILSPIGWARDQQIYNKSETNFFGLYSQGLVISIGQVLFSTPMSGISTAFDMMGSLVFTGIDSFTDAAAKLTTNIGGGFVSPRAFDDIDKMFGILTNRADIEGTTVSEKLADKIPFIGRNFAGKVVALDIFGDNVPLPSSVGSVISGLIDFTNNDNYKNKPLATWLTEEVNYFRPVPEYGSTTFKVYEKDGSINTDRKLVKGNREDEAFWTEYNKTAGSLFKEKVLDIMDKGLSPEESKEKLEEAWDSVNEKAKREMFSFSSDKPLNTTQLK